MNPNLDADPEQYEKLDQDEFEETLTKLESIIQTLEACGKDCEAKRAPDPEESKSHKEN